MLGIFGGQHFNTNLNASAIEINLEDVNLKRLVNYHATTRLRIFLKSGALWIFPVCEKPLVSIILLFHNRAEASLQCMETIIAGAGDLPFEVVIVNNASVDETSILLDKVRNAKIIHNSVNNGFGEGCNQAVDLAVGKYLLFLNNDTQLMPNSLKVMVDTFDVKKNIGGVGGKLIFPDGRLQEAGSIIWRDGSCLGYGRFEDPFKPEFSYMKDVDYCSGALFLTPRELFLTLGKFDSRYAPAYYEDVDYCLRLWEKGYRVVFQPFSIAIHHEFGSSKTGDPIKLQGKNREKFVKKWDRVLASYDFPQQDKIVFSREHNIESKRLLFIDDRIPDYSLGTGYPRTYRILQLLMEMGYKITFFPLLKPLLIPEIARSLQLKGVEVLYNETNQKINFEEFLKSRPNYYDIAFVSRPHNMQEVAQCLKRHSMRTAIVYDAEAVFSLRDVKYRELKGQKITGLEQEELIKSEVALVNDANVITTVSEMEREVFLKYINFPVQILGHVVEPNPTPAAYEERKDILFVGSFLSDISPNVDAVSFFVKQIFPLVRQEVNCEFYVVGTNQVKTVWDMESEHIHVVGKVSDLVPYYNKCRLFVVPTRYSAGIPLKLLEASAYGVPAVVTPLTADQLGWREDHDVLVGKNSEDFAQKVVNLYTNPEVFYYLRQNVLARVQDEYNSDVFSKGLTHALNLAIDEKNKQLSKVAKVD
jgi:GT2 family glycosyltransferase